MAFLDLVDRRAVSSSRPAPTCSAPSAWSACSELDLGDIDRRRRHRVQVPRGELSLRVDDSRAGEVAAPAAGQAPRPSDVETRFRTASSTSSPTRRRATCSSRARKVITAIRRYLDERRLHRGGDAGAPAALRRRDGAAVHHAPQRARSRPVPADRHRALPQAADRRRARARLRARQGLPQRGRLVQAQPRVHDVEWYEAYADYERRGGAPRAARRRRRARRPATRASSTSPAVAARDPARRDPRGDRRSTSCADRDRDALAAAIARPVEMPTEGRTWPQLVDDLLSKHVEPTLIAADVRHGLPRGAVAVRQGATAPSPA